MTQSPGNGEIPLAPQPLRPHADTVLAMEATDILRLAHEDLPSGLQNPIQALSRTALGLRHSVPVPEAELTLRSVGPWLDPSTESRITPSAARFLRIITSEGVYPERLSNTNGWELI